LIHQNENGSFPLEFYYFLVAPFLESYSFGVKAPLPLGAFCLFQFGTNLRRNHRALSLRHMLAPIIRRENERDGVDSVDLLKLRFNRLAGMLRGGRR
jgi:hypothetical protein